VTAATIRSERRPSALISSRTARISGSDRAVTTHVGAGGRKGQYGPAAEPATGARHKCDMTADVEQAGSRERRFSVLVAHDDLPLARLRSTRHFTGPSCWQQEPHPTRETRVTRDSA